MCPPWFCATESDACPFGGAFFPIVPGRLHDPAAHARAAWASPGRPWQRGSGRSPTPDLLSQHLPGSGPGTPVLVTVCTRLRCSARAQLHCRSRLSSGPSPESPTRVCSGAPAPRDASTAGPQATCPAAPFLGPSLNASSWPLLRLLLRKGAEGDRWVCREGAVLTDALSV